MRVIAVAALLWAGTASAQSPLLIKGDRIVAVIQNADFKGEVAVSVDGGRANFRWNKDRANPAQAWRWASVTKQVVAILVMQEAAKGRIDLDKPVAAYLPKFRSPNARLATVRQLLRHQSGLPNPDDTAVTPEAVPAYYQPGYTGSRDALTGYCAGPPKGAPGGNWTYNNCDFIVAGALLEAVTGKSWSRLVTERIARPLGLKTLGAFPARARTRPGFYEGRPEPAIDFAAFGASAGLYGSLDDLLAIDNALIDGKLLPQAQRDAMWDGQPKLGFIALGQWAFDAQLKDCAKPLRLIERRGAIGGVELRNFMLPEIKGAMVVFTDHSPFAFGEIWQGSGFSHDLLNAAFCQSSGS